MTKWVVKHICIMIILLLVFGGGEIGAEEGRAVKVEDALILLIINTPHATAAGNGFVVGDGSLIVTVAHIVEDGLIAAFSRYLGDGCDAEVIMTDPNLDLAVLRVPWRGHPALSLPNDAMLLSANKFELVGMPPQLSRLSSLTRESVGEALPVRREVLSVDFVGVRESSPCRIRLVGAKEVSSGCSGCPMIISGSSMVGGCFSQLCRLWGAEKPKSAEGAATAQVRRLVADAGLQGCLELSTTVRARPEDALDVFVHFVRAFWNSFGPGDDPNLGVDAQELMRCRPGNTLAFCIAARGAEESGQYQEAERYYRHALTLDPNKTATQALYDEYLMRRGRQKDIPKLAPKEDLGREGAKHRKESTHNLTSKPKCVDAENAVVLVVSYLGPKVAIGNGFVVGDGTLVVTADSVAYNYSEPSERLDSFVMVFSPYLGDGCDAEIVVSDPNLDIAVLCVPWRKHPALSLAEDQRVVSAGWFEVMGMRPTKSRRSTWASMKRELMEKSFDVQRIYLPVSYVAVRNRTPWFILLGQPEELVPDWGVRGSPMLLPGTCAVAGLYSYLEVEGPRKKEEPRVTGARGSAAAQIRRLASQAGLADCLETSSSILATPKDAADVFLLFLRTLGNARGSEAEDWIRLRPKSSLAYRMAARSAGFQGKHVLAKNYYEEAIRLDPNGTNARALYAEYLGQRGRPDDALKVLDDLWREGKSKPILAMRYVDILDKRREWGRCVRLLEQAVQANPENVELLHRLGGCHFMLEEYNEARNCLEKVVELRSKSVPARDLLARVLVMTGNLDEAELQLREIVRIVPSHALSHYHLALFLAEHRPKAKEEAIQEAKRALEFARWQGFPKEKVGEIEELIESLR